MREIDCETCLWAEDCPIKKKMMKIGRICADYYRDDELTLKQELRVDRKQFDDEWQEYISDAE